MGEQLLQTLLERLSLVIALLEEPGGVERGRRLVREQLDNFHRVKRRNLAILWQIQRDDTEQAILAHADQRDEEDVIGMPCIGAARRDDGGWCQQCDAARALEQILML